jgi:dTDP-glucose 4,6-dehydratase/UDP-glucose 4-epimerase
MAINYGRKAFDRLYIFRPHNVFGPDMGWEHVIPQFALRMARLVREQQTDPLPFPIQATGNETRAFIYIDDFVDGFVSMLSGAPGIYNIGSEQELRIAEVAHEVARACGRTIQLRPGVLAPGSTLRRCPDISKLRALGFAPRTPFSEAVLSTVRWYVEHATLAPTSASR